MPIIDCHGHLGPYPYPGCDLSVPDLLDLMSRFGIDQVFLASTQAIMGDPEGGNRALAEAIAGRPELKGYVVVNPNFPEISVKELASYLPRDNFVGAKMHAAYHSRPLNAPETRQIAKALLRYSKPLMVHLRSEQDLANLLTLAKEFSSLQIIVAEMAARWWRSAILMVAQSPNINLETGGPLADRDKIKQAFDSVGPHRLLFGSSMPLVHPSFSLGMVRDADITAAEKDALLHRNAERLFGA